MSDSNLLETTPPWNVFDSHCPTRQVLDLIADKWTVLIIRRLADGTLRFAQLRRTVDGISQKVLTNILRSLERDGIVTRRIYASVPPKVDGRRLWAHCGTIPKSPVRQDQLRR